MKIKAQKSSHDKHSVVATHTASTQARPSQEAASLLDCRDTSSAQDNLQTSIDSYPIVAAQQVQIESAFGEAIQRQPPEEEEELLQGKFISGAKASLQKRAAPPPNRTSLPDNLKAGIEAFSGLDMSDVRVHRNSSKPAQLNALAYTQGADIHVAPGQERHLPHEAWHAVQQKQGRVSPTDSISGIPLNDDRGLEREADWIGMKALQMHIAEDTTGYPVQSFANASIKMAQKENLDMERVAIPSTPPRGLAVQRYAFIKGQQVHSDKPLPNRTMSDMVEDTEIRDFDSDLEFEAYANGKTDYIGNLKGGSSNGTWIRFSPLGTNLLGERHTRVVLSEVLKAVGSRSFIHERFLDIDREGGAPQTQEAYERENKTRYKEYGIELVGNKLVYAAESLPPKLGYVMANLEPYFKKDKPINELKSPNYDGKPYQTYLKISWAYASDIATGIEEFDKSQNKIASPDTEIIIPNKMRVLANVYEHEYDTLNDFITSLPTHGYIGDSLGSSDKVGLFAPLLKFSVAFTDALIQIAAFVDESELSSESRKWLKNKLETNKGIKFEDKEKIFTHWRNKRFQKLVKEAADRDVRYAGMGNNHLKYLKEQGLGTNMFAFDMADKNLNRFEEETGKLKKEAVIPLD